MFDATRPTSRCLPRGARGKNDEAADGPDAAKVTNIIDEP
jgi:hypothetical protein